MVKKLSMFLLAVGFGIFLVAGTAMASPYALNFDPDAAVATGVSQTIWGWDLEAYAKESVPIASNGGVGPIYGNGTGALVDIVTHQSLGADGILGNGDTFSENITFVMNNGLTAPPAYGAEGYGGYYNAIYGAPKLLVDTSLTGHITAYNNGTTPTTASTPLSLADDTYTSVFDNGSGTMYVDNNGNKVYDGGDTLLASFGLAGAGPIIMTPSIFNGLGAQFSLAFGFSYANPNYFSTAPGFSDLFTNISNGFLITLEQGGIAVIPQIGGTTTPDPDQLLIAFQETGTDAKFDVSAVPEPSSLLLLGFGLIGLVGLARKRSWM